MDRSEQARIVAEEAVQVLSTALAAEWETLTDGTLSSIEGCLQQALRRVGGALVERLARLRLATLAGTTAACPRCAGRVRLVDGARARALEGLVGPLRLVRPWYHCAACRHGYAPLDGAWALGRGLLSPGLARVVSRDGLEAAFGQGADLVAENLGVHLDADTVRAVTEGLGSLVEEDQREVQRWALPADQPAPPVLAVELDGVLVHERERWVEVEVGRVAAVGPDLVVDAASGERHLALGPSSYAVEVGAADAFWERLAREARRAGLGRGVRTVVVLGDGAAWIWHPVRCYLGLPGVRVVEIVAFFHASEHLSTVADAVFGAGTPAAAVWLDETRHALRHAGPAPVLAALAAPTAEAAEDVRRASGYVTTNAARMDYPAFRAELLPIGSGAIESTAKNLIQQRQAQAGMRWTRGGAQRVASLRALHRSGRWQAFWASQPQARLRLLRALPTAPAAPLPAADADPPPSPAPTKDAPAPAAGGAPASGTASTATAGKPWAKGKDFWRRASIRHPRSA